MKTSFRIWIILAVSVFMSMCAIRTPVNLSRNDIAKRKTSDIHLNGTASSSTTKKIMTAAKKVHPDDLQSDFKYLIANYKDRYIDKTLFIRELMTHFLNLHIISRPRYFGKTLMLSTLQSFLDIKHCNSSVINDFRGLNIMNDKNSVREHMHKYPIIRLNFGHIRSKSFRKNFRLMRKEIAAAFLLHSNDLLRGNSSTLKPVDRSFYDRILEERGNDEDLAQSVKFLAEFIHQSSNHYSIILIDEYDTPIQTALENGHLAEMKKFMLSFYWSTLKANKFYWRAVFTGVTHMHCGILTGIMAIVSTVLGNTYQTFFGFTKSEVKELVERRGKGLQALSHLENVYDGYTFGRVEHMFNPWSVSNYLFCGCKMTWSAGDSQEAVEKFILGHGLYPILTIQRMLTGEFVWKNVLRQIFDAKAWEEEPAYWGYLLQLGYLSTTRRAKGIRLLDLVSNLTLRIPNLEIGSRLRIILYKRRPLAMRIPNYDQFVADLMAGRFSRAQKTIRRYVRKAGPFFNPERKGLHPELLADYVVMMLRGVERRYNSAVTVTRRPEKISIEVLPKNIQEIPVRVAIERTSVLRTTWKKMKRIWCPFSEKFRSNDTEILIACNSWFVQTCLRRVETAENI